MADVIKGKCGHVFTIWGGSISCRPELYFEPETTGHKTDAARAAGKKVKVVGCGHSNCKIAMTTDYMINMTKYDRLLHIDKEKGQVKVEAGMQMRKLNRDILPTNGLAVGVQPNVDDISIGGAISVGARGPGEKFQILATKIVEIEMMTSSGDVIVISDQKNPDLLPAARLALGSLGIILNVTLQCEPAFNLHEKKYGAKFEQVMDDLDSLSSASDHFSFTWQPYTEGGQVILLNRTDKPVDVKFSWFWQVLVGGIMYGILLWICALIPRLFRVVQKLYHHIVFKHPSSRIDRSDNVFTTPLPNAYIAELVILRSNAAAALRDIRRWALSKEGPVFPFVVNLIFCKKDEIYLSPTYERDGAIITFIIPRVFDKVLPVEKYLRAFEEIMLKYGARPFWPVDNNLTSDQLEKMFPKWQTFHNIRKRVDPSGMFMNPFLVEKFGE